MLETYIPSDASISIRYKLTLACQDPLNKPMAFCVNLQKGLIKGTLFYRNARTLHPGFMTAVYHWFGGTYQGMEGAIFTEPQSEEYCIQYYSLWARVPVNHPDSRLDIKKILKLRVNAETHACLEYHYLEAMHPTDLTFPTLEEANHFMVERLKFYWTAENFSHPIYAYYNETARILEAQINSNATVSFIDAAYNGYKNLHRLSLTNESTVTLPDTHNIYYGSLAMEETRLRLAEKMFKRINNASNLSPMQALIINARTDINTAIDIAESFEQGNLRLHSATRSIYHTFESLTNYDEGILISLANKDNLGLADALKYLTYLKDFRLEEYYYTNHLLDTAPSLNHFKNNLTALETCGPYTASTIISSVAAGLFGHILKENMLPCRELAKQIAHPGFHLHNFFSEDYHFQAHKLEDTLRADETMMKIVLFMMFLTALAMVYGTAKFAYKPLSRCSARLFCKSKKAAAVNDNTFSPEHRILIKKTETSTTKITTSRTTFWTTSGDIESAITVKKNVKKIVYSKV
jgi:hypothetical protein